MSSSSNTVTASNDQDFNFRTGNYPRQGDTTAQGGYSQVENTWSARAQRGRIDDSNNSTGLIDQSVDGGPLGDQIQDAVQGKDTAAREEYQQEARRDFGKESGSAGLRPYGENPDSRQEVAEMLASQYRRH